METIKGINVLDHNDFHNPHNLNNFIQLVDAFSILINFVRQSKIEIALRMNDVLIVIRPEN